MFYKLSKIDVQCLFYYFISSFLNPDRYKNEWYNVITANDHSHKPPVWKVVYSVPGEDSNQTDGSSCGVFTGMSLYLYAKSGSGLWPTNSDLNTADILSARDFMMYMIYFEKTKQHIQTLIEIEDSEEQQALDAVATFIRAQQKLEVATPTEVPLIIED